VLILLWFGKPQIEKVFKKMFQVQTTPKHLASGRMYLQLDSSEFLHLRGSFHEQNNKKTIQMHEKIGHHKLGSAEIMEERIRPHELGAQYYLTQNIKQVCVKS
jgi:hypothetical protein